MVSNYFDAHFLAELETHFLEFELLNFSAARQGELIDEENIFRGLVTGYLALAEVAHVFGLHLHTFVEDDESTHFFSIFL